MRGRNFLFIPEPQSINVPRRIHNSMDIEQEDTHALDLPKQSKKKIQNFHSPSFVFAAEHSVHAEARVFNQATIYIAPDDTVKFNNITSHNAVSYIVDKNNFLQK